jgi:hypothetical protein
MDTMIESGEMSRNSLRRYAPAIVRVDEANQATRGITIG